MDNGRTTHALLIRDNWDGEGYVYWSFACKKDEHWLLISEGTDRTFPEYQGDEILKTVPLTCEHNFHYFGDQKIRRCNKCSELEKQSS